MRPKCFAFGTAVVQRRSASCPPRRSVKDLSGKRAPRPDLLQISGVLNYYILIKFLSVFSFQGTGAALFNAAGCRISHQGPGTISRSCSLIAHAIYCINKSGSRLLFHTVSSIVPSAVQVLTVVFGMRTGVAPARIATRQT